MEPFLAIGELLKEKGHQVICAFPEQFRNLAEDSNLEFASLGAKYIEMLDSNIGKAAMGGDGSGLKKFLAYISSILNRVKCVDYANQFTFYVPNTATAISSKSWDIGIPRYFIHIWVL